VGFLPSAHSKHRGRTPEIGEPAKIPARYPACTAAHRRPIRPRPVRTASTVVYSGEHRESALVTRASRGDVDVFSKLVQELSGLVHRVTLRVLGAEDAQDASQGVWIRVCANIKNFRGESAFSTWLYRITMNTCLGILRRQ
jgi:hypothetical protein